MSRRTRIIRFPVERTSEARAQQRAADIEHRVNALPEAIRELDVAWIFKAADKRTSSLR